MECECRFNSEGNQQSKDKMNEQYAAERVSLLRDHRLFGFQPRETAVHIDQFLDLGDLIADGVKSGVGRDAQGFDPRFYRFEPAVHNLGKRIQPSCNGSQLRREKILKHLANIFNRSHSYQLRSILLLCQTQRNRAGAEAITCSSWPSPALRNPRLSN